MPIFITEAAEYLMQKSYNPLHLIMAERIRQQTEEGYAPAQDDKHTEGQLALLAAAYALTSRSQRGELYSLAHIESTLFKAYGWRIKPKDPIRDLVRAGALILAELERRLRAEAVGKLNQGFLIPGWDFQTCDDAHNYLTKCQFPKGHSGPHLNISKTHRQEWG